VPRSQTRILTNNCNFVIWLCSALNERQYYYAGHILAVSLVHGGPAPRCLSQHVFAAVIEKVALPLVSLDDLVNDEYKEQVLEVYYLSHCHKVC